jgi:hypothetical protein
MAILVASIWFTGLMILQASSGAADGMSIGPVDVPVTVHHVPLIIPVVVRLAVTPAGDTLDVAANATGSLAKVQESAKEIANALLIRTRGCNHAGVGPVVDRIDDAHLNGTGDEALLAVSGHATAWACTKIFGQMVKTILAASDIRIELPLRLQVEPGNAIGLVLAHDPHIALGDPKASALVDAFSGDIDKLARRALDHALDTSKARLAIPAIAGIDGKIESVSFASQGKELSVAIAAKAHMSAIGLTRLLALTVDKSTMK